MIEAAPAFLQQDPYSTEGAARRAVQTGAAWGLVHFPANFSYHMARRQVMLQDADEEDVDGSEVTVHIDMSSESRRHPTPLLE